MHSIWFIRTMSETIIRNLTMCKTITRDVEAAVFELFPPSFIPSLLPLSPLDDVIFSLNIFFLKFFWQELFSRFVKRKRFYAIIILKKTKYETKM